MDTMKRDAVVIKGLTKCYTRKARSSGRQDESVNSASDRQAAVDHIDLTIREGELLALLGVNGAGKTTTIRMLSGLSVPTEGDAEVLGHSVVREQAEVKKLIGISPQDTAVAENLTVEENLRFMAGIYKEHCDIEDIIRAFSLTEVRNKRAKVLSGGWKRRLSIAMALVGKPKILFLDEPTLGLDVLARRELWKVIEGLKHEMTIVLTTHYMEEAEALSDRVAIMTEGKIVRLGTVQELELETGKKGLEEVFVSVVEKG